MAKGGGYAQRVFDKKQARELFATSQNLFKSNSNGGFFKPDLFQCYARGALRGGEFNDDQKDF